MATVATSLTQVRPTAVSAAVLLALALTPHHHVVPAAERAVSDAAMQRRLETLRVELDHLDTPPVIRPAPHPDARAWPQGMVIGMGTPSVDPAIVVWDGSPLHNLLSVMLAPLRLLAT